MKNNLELKPMTVARLTVLRKNNFGAFLDAGTGDTNDDILLHNAQQTSDVKVGESLEVFLYLDPKKRLTASMRVPKIQLGEIAQLEVVNVTHDGAFLDAGAERGIFMPFAEMIGRPQIGDVVWAKLYTDKSGRLALSMKIPKATSINLEAEALLKFIHSNGGETNLNDKTAPEVIFEALRMSKAAFKRAAGHLLRERLIEKTDGGFRAI